MPRRSRSSQTANNGSTYIKLEERLILLAWLNSLFGYNSNKDMLTDLKDTGEGFDPEGRSFIYHHLVGRGDKLRIPLEKLKLYDENIRKHLAAVNQGRIKAVTLRYFQYLALLYTEIFLDWRFNHLDELLHQLNAFVVTRNTAKAPGEQPDPLFTEDDLNKVAFWMDTGSGKTLIMHINYYQFLHYNRRPLDNILLITPNEGLSEQHMVEMDASNIPYERVSNMGLLNIGRSEGSQIIQLFGRGVRLRGRDFSLKRSSALDGEHPRPIRLLETLNIFAVRANYMTQFRAYLEREGVETEGHIELPLAIRPNRNFLTKELLVPELPEGRSFTEECWLLLAPDLAAKVTVDMTLKLDAIRSQVGGVATLSMRAGQEQVIPPASLNLVDWQAVYLELLKFKEQKGFSNLILRPETPRQLLEFAEPRLYKLLANETVVKPQSFEQLPLLQEAVLSILRKYIEKYYRVYQERWETRNMTYDFLDVCHPNFKNYTVKIPRSEKQLIAAVKQLIDEGQRIYEQETRELPNIYFDRHLYQPLLIERDERVKAIPPGLKESERRFVEDLRKYVRREAGGKLAGPAGGKPGGA
ncbi:DEAD/DEAH box helicase family protein [Moorella sp. Hama-1]|uniref:DEAD/DEAH box helicase family protein n=1 Tax=Moorella sp. Hama-1 TaxID=2138101 RepID=UPI001914B4ED|nr:DEAD/DEAH box helicase family protein [Moorella sp. Hama-1]BCV21899.1 hypothetical protein hamaS1_19680 [Moorella sp. Hama-1]